MGMNYGNKDGRDGNFLAQIIQPDASLLEWAASKNINDPQSYLREMTHHLLREIHLILMFSTGECFQHQKSKPAANSVLQGFSGCLIVEHLDALVQGVLKPFTWALAGRSLPKLEKMASQCRSRPKVRGVRLSVVGR